MFNGSLILIIIAGVMNGSFVIPMRYIKSSSEIVWLYHSIIGMALIPWVILAVMMPGAFPLYSELHSSDLCLLIISGAIFGLGQVFFAYAIEMIGISLSFAINLGLGVTIGSMFVVFSRSVFFSTQGYVVTLAVLLIVCSLIVYYFSGKNNRGRNQIIYSGGHLYHRGWMLATLTGLTSGLQNIAFMTVISHSAATFDTTNLFWVWPPFLLAAVVPMFLGFLYRIRRGGNAFQFLGGKGLFLVCIMGLFFTGSLALYSGGVGTLSHDQQIIGWPALMVSIILASQVWGWIYLENKAASKKSKLYMVCSICLLLAAIILLAIEN